MKHCAYCDTEEDCRAAGRCLSNSMDAIKGQQELRFTIPGVPPGLNHYVRHFRNGGHRLTDEAVRFKRDVGVIVHGKTIEGRTFEVEIVVYFGKGDKGDADGLGKVAIDALAEAHVFRKDRPGRYLNILWDRPPLTDNCVSDVILRKRRDRHQPRTEITVRRTNVDV